MRWQLADTCCAPPRSMELRRNEQRRDRDSYMIKKLWPLLVLFPTFPVHAQDALKPCDRPDITQNEINNCTGDQAAALEKELDVVYRSVLSSISGDKALSLKIQASERSWVVFRDSFIQSAFPSSGPHAERGSMLPTEINELRSQLTREQIAHLSYLKHLYEGGQI